jgi:hypothetical protein
MFGVPAMACLQPSVPMSEEENACCREMAGNCGEMGTNSTHSCCQTVVSRDEDGFATQAFALEHTLQTYIVVVAGNFDSPIVGPAKDSFLSGASPPGLPPSSQITVLRI